MSAEANAVSRQGMLFGDPLEGLETDEVGYRGPIACNAAGITYRQLDYWARTGLLQPSIPVSYTHLTLPTNREV